MAVLEVFLGDITKVEVDVIVNAANSSLLGGSGVDGAIHKAAGETVLEECLQIRYAQGGCKVGKAVITSAGKLRAKCIVHTVGPFWAGGANQEEDMLSKCYISSLNLAIERQFKTIAFPNISTGTYRFPKEIAARIAIESVMMIIANTSVIEKVLFVCFDKENYSIYQKLLQL